MLPPQALGLRSDCSGNPPPVRPPEKLSPRPSSALGRVHSTGSWGPHWLSPSFPSSFPRALGSAGSLLSFPPPLPGCHPSRGNKNLRKCPENTCVLSAHVPGMSGHVLRVCVLHSPRVGEEGCARAGVEVVPGKGKGCLSCHEKGPCLLLALLLHPSVW